MFKAEHVEVHAQKLFKTIFTLIQGRVEAAKHGIENSAALRVCIGNSASGEFSDVATPAWKIQSDEIAYALLREHCWLVTSSKQ